MRRSQFKRAAAFQPCDVQRPATALVREKRSNSTAILPDSPTNVHEPSDTFAPRTRDVGILPARRLIWAFGNIDQNTVSTGTSNKAANDERS